MELKLELELDVSIEEDSTGRTGEEAMEEEDNVKNGNK